MARTFLLQQDVSPLLRTSYSSLFPEQATGDVKYVLIYDVASVCSHDY